MKANTMKAFNKRRKRMMLRIFEKAFGLSHAARRNYREKQLDRFFIKHHKIELLKGLQELYVDEAVNITLKTRL